MSKRKNKNIDFITQIFMEIEGASTLEELKNKYKKVVSMYGKDTIIDNDTNDIMYFNMNNSEIENSSLPCYLSYTNDNNYLIRQEIITSLEKRCYYEHMNIRIREMLKLLLRSPLFIFDDHEDIRAISCSLIPSRRFNISSSTRMKVSEDLKSDSRKFYLDVYMTIVYRNSVVERTVIPLIDDHHIYNIIAEYKDNAHRISKIVTLIFLLVDYIASAEYIDFVVENVYKIPPTKRLVNTAKYNYRKVKVLTSIEETTLPTFGKDSFYYLENGFLWEFDIPFKEYSEIIYKKYSEDSDTSDISSFLRDYELNRNRVVFNLSEKTFLKLIEQENSADLESRIITIDELKELPCTNFTVTVPSKGINANIKIDFDSESMFFDFVGECFCLNCISFKVSLNKFDLGLIKQDILASVENIINKNHVNSVFGSLDSLNNFIVLYTVYISVFIMKHIAEVNVKRRKKREENLLKGSLKEKVKNSINVAQNEIAGRPYFEHKVNISPLTIFEVTAKSYSRVKTSTLRKKGYKVSTHYRSGHYNHYWVGKGNNKKLIAKYIPGKIINEPEKEDYTLTTVKQII